MILAIAEMIWMLIVAVLVLGISAIGIVIGGFLIQAAICIVGFITMPIWLGAEWLQKELGL